MTKCKCFKNLVLDKYDDDGFLEEEDAVFINRGDEFCIDESKDRIVGSNKTMRLVNNDTWIEITVDTFFKHFSFEE